MGYLPAAVAASAEDFTRHNPSCEHIIQRCIGDYQLRTTDYTDDSTERRNQQHQASWHVLHCTSD